MIDMRKLFNDILSTDGVKGILLFSFSGDLIFKEYTVPVDEELEHRDWSFFIESLEGMRETDLVFEKGRIYICRTEVGYLVILMALFVPIAMRRRPAAISMLFSKKWPSFLPMLTPAMATANVIIPMVTAARMMEMLRNARVMPTARASMLVARARMSRTGMEAGSNFLDSSSFEAS